MNRDFIALETEVLIFRDKKIKADSNMVGSLDEILTLCDTENINDITEDNVFFDMLTENWYSEDNVEKMLNYIQHYYD